MLSVILNIRTSCNTIILFHDFWNRYKYHVILKYVDVIDRADTLGVFRIREEVDFNLVKQDYEAYKYVPY